MENTEKVPEKGRGVSINLKDIPSDKLLSVELVAKFLQVTSRTVLRMAARHELPRPVRMGHRNYWNAGRLLAWINRLVEEGEREAEAKLKRIRDFS